MEDDVFLCGQGRYRINDKFLHGGQLPRECVADLLQRDRIGNGYSERLRTVGLGTLLHRKHDLPFQEIQANRNKLTFYVTDKLAEMWNRG